MAFKTNGSTFSFDGSGVTKLTGVTFSESGEEIDVTDLGDTEKKIELGTVAREMSVKHFGDPGYAVGDVGDAVFTLADGETITLTNAICVSREKAGDLNGALLNTSVFKPADA